MSSGTRLRAPVFGRRAHGRAFAWLSAAAQLEAVLSVVVTALIIRELGLSVAGQVFFAQAAAAVYFAVVDPRLEDSLQRFVPLLDVAKPRQVRHFIRRLAIGDATLGLAFGVAGVALVLGVSGGGDSSQFLALAIAAGGIGAAQGTAGACFAVCNALDRLGRLRVALAAGGAVVSLPVLWAEGAGAYLVAQVVVQGLSSWLLVGSGLRLVATRWTGDDRGPLPGGFLRFTLLSSASTSAGLGTDNAVIALSSALTSSTVAAGLKIAQAPGRLMFTAFAPLWAILYPRLATLAAAGDVNGLRRRMARSSAAVAAISALGLGSAALLLPVLLPRVYGADTDAFATAATVFMGVYGVRATVGWSKVAPLALGRPGLKLLMTTVEGVALLGAVALLLVGQELAAVDAVQRVAIGALLTACGLAAGWGLLMARLEPVRAPS